MPGTFVKINSATDTITDTAKVTTGYFSNGSGKLLGSSIYTSSLTDANENYYIGITGDNPASVTSPVTQFTVAYGHYAGSGSNTDADDIKGATQAIYNQWATTLLGENEVTGGFKISANGSYLANATVGAGTRDEDVYVLVGRRSLFKERINKGNSTLAFSGSAVAGGGTTKLLELTDDSKTATPVSTVAGPRHAIISGTDGTAATGHDAATRTFGFFWPDAGVMVFSQRELSASICGKTNCTSSVATENAGGDSVFNGFAPSLHNDANQKNALKFVNCLKAGASSDTYVQMRSEEDQTSVAYFCRATAGQFNFSNNPTFVSGSSNSLRHTDMFGNPVTYITGVGLYNTSGQLVAIAKLSTPLKKNFSSEATIKVKLTY